MAQAAPLFINAEGGAINFGPQRTHPAFAYGKISENGTVIASSSNITGVGVYIASEDERWFQIKVEGGFKQSDVCIANDTTAGSPFIMTCQVTNDGLLEIVCWNDLNRRITEDMNFVVYRTDYTSN